MGDIQSIRCAWKRSMEFHGSLTRKAGYLQNQTQPAEGSRQMFVERDQLDSLLGVLHLAKLHLPCILWHNLLASTVTCKVIQGCVTPILA